MADDRRTPSRKPVRPWGLLGQVSATPERGTKKASKERMQLAKSGPMGGITDKMLSDQAGKLKPVTKVNTPFADNLTIKRDGVHRAENRQTAQQFTDFVVETRRHLTELAATSAGRDLFAAIKSHGDARKIKIRDAGEHGGLREAQVPSGSKFDAERETKKKLGRKTYEAGSGIGSTVYHHADIGQRWGEVQQPGSLSSKSLDSGIGMSGALALGHELIHAARAQAGLQASGKAHSGVPFEEIETVGRPDGTRTFSQIPTENALRKAMSKEVFKDSGLVGKIRSRKTYSGKKL